MTDVEGTNGYPTRIRNFRLQGILASLVIFFNGLQKSQSADGDSGITVENDGIRFLDRITDLRAEWAYITKRPALDLPESSGVLTWAIAQIPTEFEVPNNKDIIRMMNEVAVMHFEVANCASASQASAINAFDKDRFNALLDDLEGLLTDYIQIQQPSDNPDTTPDEGTTGAGSLGVV